MAPETDMEREPHMQKKIADAVKSLRKYGWV